MRTAGSRALLSWPPPDTLREGARLFLPVPGGVLILDGDGRAFGADGISGDTSDCDEYCAIEGIKSAGLGCDPPEPAPGGSPAGSTSHGETHARRGHAK